MEEIDTASQAVLDAISSRVTNHYLARGLRLVVGEKQRRGVASQASDRDLAHELIVVPQANLLVQISDLLMTPLGGVDHGLDPAPGGYGGKSTDNGCASPADGDEEGAQFIDTVQLGVIDKLGVEVQPFGVLVGEGMPEHDEAHQFAVLLGSCNGGVGQSTGNGFLLQSEERQHTGASLPTPGQVMVLQRRRFATERDGVEVE